MAPENTTLWVFLCALSKSNKVMQILKKVTNCKACPLLKIIHIDNETVPKPSLYFWEKVSSFIDHYTLYVT